MYTKKTLKRFTHPKNAGELKNADAIGEIGNVKCGDMMKIFIKVKDDVIKDIKFLTYGCVAAIASTDAMCQLAKGKKLKDALKITFKDILKELGDLPKIKYHCSVMGVQALRKAIENYKKRQKCVGGSK